MNERQGSSSIQNEEVKDSLWLEKEVLLILSSPREVVRRSLEGR